MKYRITFASLLLATSGYLFAETPTNPAQANQENQQDVPHQETKTAVTQQGLKQKESQGKAEESKTENRIERLTGEPEATSDETASNSLAKKLENEAKDKALSEINTENKSEKPSDSNEESSDPAIDALNKEQKLLMLENIVKEERQKKENEKLRAKLQRLKWEKEALNTELDILALKREADNQKEDTQHQEKLLKLTREAELAEAKSRKLTNDLETQRLEWEMKTAKLESEIKEINIEQEREKYANNKPVYLDNPVVNGDTLVISDRRIAMNGLITGDTADYITTRIHYYNNKDATKPIFIVIDSSPGGSAMAGYRIIKAMEASKAPVYVVVKSLAASMAAIITTVAENSFAYPNAIIVHHQLSITVFLARLNVTQQKEMYEDSQKWWDRMMKPIAKKMGITPEEFIKKMYEKASSGDWSEFGTEAKELKWVNNIVQRIEETSLVKDPDATDDKEDVGVHEEITAEGRAVVYLPHLSPKDAYFVYNPDKYYQIR